MAVAFTKSESQRNSSTLKDNCEYTHTTPTLTPSRLRSIEEKFFDCSVLPPKPFLHQHMAGFRIPQVNFSSMIKSFTQLYGQQSKLYELSQDSCGGEISSNSSEMATEETLNDFSNGDQVSKGKKNENRKRKQPEKKDSSEVSLTPAKRSTGGGRKPKNDKVSPEEDLKRQKRRERNKLAAARCRKKRVDQTNTLEEQRNIHADEHKELCEKMRRTMEMYCAQETKFAEHNKTCKNFMSLTSSLPLLSDVDYQEIQKVMCPPEEDDGDDETMSDVTQPPVAAPPVPIVRPNIPITSVVVPPVGLPIGPSTIQSQPSTTIPSATSVTSNAIPQSHTNIPVASSGPLNDPLICAPPQTTAPNRPTSLGFPFGTSSIPSLQTPSNGFFDGLESGSGLTPVLNPSSIAFLRTLASPLTDTPENKTFTSM